MVSPKFPSYAEEDSSADVVAILIYPLHLTGMKLIDMKNIFGINDATTKHTPGAEICTDPDMEYLSLTKAHRISMNRLIHQCYLICIVINVAYS